MKNILFVGPPGAGKGSLTLMLSSLKHHRKIVCGDIFRDHIKNQTKIGREFISYINRGQLAPDIVVNKMMKAEFNHKFLQNKGEISKKSVIIWDGYPRNINQAQFFDDFLKEDNLKLDLVIWIDVNLEVIIERIVNRLVCPKCHQIYNKKTRKPKKPNQCDKCQTQLYVRSDDQADLITTRYNEFLNETKPLLEFYQRHNIVEKIDGTKDLKVLFEECQKLITKP